MAEPSKAGAAEPAGSELPAIAVAVFPGTNCEHDTLRVLRSLGASADLVWHDSCSLDSYDAVVIPGGFAHGDYLRPGALARFSPVMSEIERMAANGAPVLGICNGFQILTEARLLPGALRRNAGARFICAEVDCVVASTSSVLTSRVSGGDVLRLPINHFEGSYACRPGDLEVLEERGQILLRYAKNPNGSAGSIAAVSNETGNVVGLMPHPERASDLLLGSQDGLVLLRAFVSAAGERKSRPAPPKGHAPPGLAWQGSPSAPRAAC